VGGKGYITAALIMYQRTGAICCVAYVQPVRGWHEGGGMKGSSPSALPIPSETAVINGVTLTPAGLSPTLCYCLVDQWVDCSVVMSWHISGLDSKYPA
jgi:hypothetical protein